MEAVIAVRQDRQAPSTQYDKHPTILRSARQVLSALSQIDDLRIRSGQQGDLSTDLLLILSRHNAHQRRPVLVLLYAQGLLSAAVIFAERQILGFGLGLLRAGDPAGDGTVIAPGPARKAALFAAMDALLKSWRYHTIAATLSGETTGIPAQSIFTEVVCRFISRRLPLSSTLDETLRERFTPRKRKNLLYYIRSLSKTHDVEFVPQLPIAETKTALLDISQHSWPHRTPAEIALHCDFLRRHPECFCMGIRLKGGTWLSLITGWRIDGITHMPWQLNHTGYKDKSLMQVMRTHLIAHECAMGQTALSWVGGTVSFQTACDPEPCLDVLKARPGIRFGLLRHFIAPFLFRRNPDEFTSGSLLLVLPLEVRAAPSATLPAER